MAFRDERIRLFNMTSHTLTFTNPSASLQHGIFTDSFSPPPTIVPDQLAEWRAESSGIGTGSEGNVDYRVDGLGDVIRFHWDNPAAGNTFFGFEATDANGGPSAFTFFALRFGFDGSIEPPPGQLNPLFAVSWGDTGNDGIIFPFPFQEHLVPHAWFDIGLRDRREPINVGRWLKALSEATGDKPSFSALFPGRTISVRALIELPIEH